MESTGAARKVESSVRAGWQGRIELVPDAVPGVPQLALRIARAFEERNRVLAPFAHAEARRLVLCARQMADRFRAGGRLLAFGRGPHATDAQHVAVSCMQTEAGARAVPALDLSASFDARLPAVLHRADVVMGFGPPGGDLRVNAALSWARLCGTQTFGLAGGPADYALHPYSVDPFIHQEVVELLHHLLWDTAQLYVQCAERDHDQVAGAIAGQSETAIRLRTELERAQAEPIARAIVAIRERLEAGGKLILFGHGVSATDANDWAIDTTGAREGGRPRPAISLAMEPALLTALAGDVGPEWVFARPLAVHATPADVAIALWSGGSVDAVRRALAEAQRRGLLTVALLGHGGGQILSEGLAAHPLVVRSDVPARIQELHASIYHVMCDLVAEVP